MKKVLITLLLLATMTTLALATEETVVYGDTTYTYGGQAIETTDDNGNGYLDGLMLRGLDEALYFSAGEGFAYFTPAGEDSPATLILDNATICSDFGIQAVTDLSLILVGENVVVGTHPDLFTIRAMEAYDENMELLPYEERFFYSVTIQGEGSLDIGVTGYAGVSMGHLAIYSGDVTVTTSEGNLVAIELGGYEITNQETAFELAGGSLCLDLADSTEWGIAVFSRDVCITGGTLDITGGSADGIGLVAYPDAGDLTFSITGGHITLGDQLALGTAILNTEYTSTLLIDFSESPDSVLQVSTLFFCGTLELYGGAGTIDLPILNEGKSEVVTEIHIDGYSDYLYCIDQLEYQEEDGSFIGLSSHVSFEGNPAITPAIRSTLVYPYTTEEEEFVSFTFTRGQVIALLWDSMGCPDATIDNPFTDVTEADTYYQAILWAVEQGITTGTTETTFSPDALCTKGQLLTFLYRNAGEPEVTVENLFADVAETDYIYDAVLWGIANTMMDLDEALFDADSTEFTDGAIGYLICMFQ